jgi:enoyl-CoA hydratase
MTQFHTVEVSRKGGIGELRLSRPEVHNRFDELLIEELAVAVQELGDDRDVRAVILSSEGRHFSAGGDTAVMLASNADLRVLLPQLDDGRRLFRSFADFPKPLIAAVQGHVFGVATSIVLTADAIVSTPGVKFADPHVHFGLVAGDGGCVTWPASLPFARAKRHLLWGQPILAEEAFRLGLVSDLVDRADAVHGRAHELAEEVAALPPMGVQLTKRALNKVLAARVDEAFDTGFYLQAISVQTADLREAVAAFEEKRPGVWSGR